MVSPRQRPLPDNTQHSQQTDIHATRWISTRNPSQRVATDPRLKDRAATRIGILSSLHVGVGGDLLESSKLARETSDIHGSKHFWACRYNRQARPLT